ncbi:hypothetical protein [Amaricoccus sp.]|uniref:hypothetical protein n=1 Tax=Amaricoccus sp. TaxID=1872485 RepID=UPI001B4AD728|nr:hypothetical protein [Amaricoccus sp.]MBP7242359.1 cadherin repeat domain-containing protein [Amaricoccus sp.]
MAIQTIERRVASATDDAEEKSSGSISSNVGDLELGFDGSKVQKVGIRFTDLGIPQGAQITAAYIQFTVDESNSSASSLLIRGEDSNDAATFSNAKFNISSRPLTDASVDWSPEAWTPAGASGAAQRTADISAVVQEIVNRSGWTASNAMAFVISGTGTRTADSFEDSPGTAPLLHIEYTLPGGGSPVAFDAQPDADPDSNQIAELAIAGAPTGITASAHDPDGDTVTYSINDSRFTIDANTGVITRSGNGTLDFETQTTVTLTVTAHSSDSTTATRQFTLNILDSQEPVAFRSPADANSAANTIAQSAGAGTGVGITASANDPDAGDTVSYTIDDNRFSISPSGVITRSSNGTLNAQNEPSITLRVTATSSDSSTDTHDYTLAVTGGGGGGGGLPSSLTLVRTTLTSQWSPPSPDPSGLVYISHLGRMLMVDGEVEELPIFEGKNVYEMQLNGTLVSTASTVSFSDEPTDIAYNPNNHHIYISDDTGSRGFYVVDPGNDDLYFTSDDKRTFANTGPFGAKDAEGIAYDTTRNVMYIASGADQKIFTISPGANGKFDGAPSKGGDDTATSFNTLPLGINDPEAVAYDAVHDVLFVPASKTSIAMLTPDGELLDTFNVSQIKAHKIAGLALAPSSDDPDQMSLYVTDRGRDGDSSPNYNDGKIHEFHIDDFLFS